MDPNDLARERLGALEQPLASVLDRLERKRILPRIWHRDHTVWGKGPIEVVDRLGWLDAPSQTLAELPRLEALADEIRADGIRDVVLLGMGGSSLGAEVLRVACEAEAGSPTLHVVDSTVPGWVRGVRQGIDPSRAVFLVGSKSGTTVEVATLEAYFWSEATQALGREPGDRFVAITDPGSPLDARASERGFRAIFRNDPEIGGRFSVLSFFGMVAAAAAGLDVEGLLAAGRAAAEDCGPDVPVAENPGARLGAILHAAAEAGRDKLTILTSPRLAAFGLWAEQLVAESTGKEGKGILPIATEPGAAADRYRSDRLFVFLTLAGDPAPGLETHAEALRAEDHPVVELRLARDAELGGELYRWQMATAVVGYLLGIQPFDQPDVDATKRETRRFLEAFESGAPLPEPATGTDLAAALGEGTTTFVALMAYLPPSEALETAVDTLRRRLLDEHGLATTFGYAPRMLHSTGQYHKGGPEGGLFVQLLAVDDGPPLEIPGRGYDFATLARAQALGDAAALVGAGRRTLRIPIGEPEQIAHLIGGS